MSSLLILDKDGHQKIIQFDDRDILINDITKLARDGIITREQAIDYCELIRFKSLERVIREGNLIYEVTTL